MQGIMGFAPAVCHGIQRIPIVIKIWWNVVGVVSVFTMGARTSITKYLQTREPYGSAIIVLLSNYVPTYTFWYFRLSCALM